MRKVVPAMIILLMLSAVVFFIGWVSFFVKPNQAGVVFTKTSGWSKEVVLPGNFAWYWEKLLPTNLTLYIYEPKIYVSSIEINRDLPSASHYSKYLDGTPDFSFFVDCVVEWSIDLDYLPTLASQRKVLPEGLSEIEESLEISVKNSIQEKIFSVLPKMSTDGAMSLISLNSFTNEIIKQVAADIPSVRINHIQINDYKFPDFDLYISGKEMYRLILESRQQAVQQANASVVFEDMMSERQLEALKTYGKVITDYPLLLEYFNLTAQTDTDPLYLQRPASPLRIID